MRVKTISKTTTNRGVFNRAYKELLERKGRIHCSRCKYHKGENYEGKWYGEYIYDDMNTCRGKSGTHTKLPNWKLVSKQPKQWMKKPIKFVDKQYGGYRYIYVDIKW